MTTTRRLMETGAAAAVLWAATAGCTSQPKHLQTWHTQGEQPMPSAGQESKESQQASPQQDEPNRKVDQMEANAGSADSADALTRKAEAYSRELSPLMNQRAAAQAGGPSLPSQPSAVQWMDPSQFRIGGDFSHDAMHVPPPSPDGRATVKTAIDTKPITQEPAVPSGPGPALASASDTPSLLSHMPEVKSAVPSSDALVDKLTRRVKDYPRDVSAQLEYQLLQFLLDEPSPQISTVSSLPTEDREVVSAVLDGLTNFRNALRADANMLLSKKIKPILDMAERLRSQADLTIPTVALCTKVDGYGNYEPIEPARFGAGAAVDQKAVVYCEVANFTSNLTDKQMWETRLSLDMTLYTEAGLSVWSDKSESINDSSRNRRHDFFVCKIVALPKALTIGRYLLKVSVVDTQSNRVAEATVPIVIAAQ